MADEKTMCSKCESSEVESDGYPRWCNRCKASYKREYEATKAGRAEKKGFAAGVTAMREVLSDEFEKLGSGRFAAFEVARLIQNAPGPKLD